MNVWVGGCKLHNFQGGGGGGQFHGGVNATPQRNVFKGILVVYKFIYT